MTTVPPTKHLSNVGSGVWHDFMTKDSLIQIHYCTVVSYNAIRQCFVFTHSVGMPKENSASSWIQYIMTLHICTHVSICICTCQFKLVKGMKMDICLNMSFNNIYIYIYIYIYLWVYSYSQAYMYIHRKLCKTDFVQLWISVFEWSLIYCIYPSSHLTLDVSICVRGYFSFLF